MTLFEETLTKLNEEYKLSIRKIIILDSLKYLPRRLTSGEKEILNKIQRTNTGIIALLLEHKAKQYKKKNELSLYEPFVLDQEEDKENFLDFLCGLPYNKSYRYDFIIGGSGKHATPVSIISDGENNVSIFSLDAAVFYDNFAYIDLLSAASKATRIYAYDGGGIQNSNYGCTIYSIQHLSAMSKMSEAELAHMFSKAIELEEDQFIGFSPKFVRNIQSVASANKYISASQAQEPVSKRRSFAEYLEQHKRAIVEEDTDIVQRNYAHAYKTHKYIKIAYEMLHQLTEESFEEIIFNRSVKRVFEQEFCQLGSQKIEGLYNYHKIKLVQKGFFTKEALSGDMILPFGPKKEDSFKAYERIISASVCEEKLAYEVPSERDFHLKYFRNILNAELGKLSKLKLRELYLVTEDVLNKGHSIEERLLETGNPHIIEAVYKYKIDENKAIEAECFKDDKDKGIAISFIRKVYNKAPEGLKDKYAQQFFELIKDKDCTRNSEVKKDYDSFMILKSNKRSPSAIIQL